MCEVYLPTTVLSLIDKRTLTLSYNCFYQVASKIIPSSSLYENDKIFRTFIKKITYGRYQPPCENTAYSELLNLVAETESNIRNVISRYQHEGLMVSISTDIWSENGKSFCVNFIVMIS